jgi:hypothetical protein
MIQSLLTTCTISADVAAQQAQVFDFSGVVGSVLLIYEAII